MFRAGQQIGIYTLINRIGRGGFGEVWLAERRAKFATTQVALKLPLDDQVDHATIEQEAKLWAQASGHPNVLPIIEADDYDGQIVIVSEYAPEGSLEQLLKKNDGSLPLSQAVELTVGILKGLEFLHSRKIIHRDLKPGNILLQGDTPRLADFGISRAMRTTSVSANIAGTPKYMAPEAFDGKRNVQTDIWSVGVLLYQMLTGRLPFPQEHYGELIGAIVIKEPEPLPETVSAVLRNIISKALSKNPTERYSSAREMRDELIRIEEHSILTVVRPVTLPAITKVKAKTNSLYFATLAVVLLLVAVTGGVYLLSETKSTTGNTKAAPTATPLPSGITATTLIPFRKGDKWGFCDVNKKLVIEAMYDEAEPFSEGLARVHLKGECTFIDRTGEKVNPFQICKPSGRHLPGLTKVRDTYHSNYKVTDKNENELLAVRLNDKYGFTDRNGKEIIHPQYDDVTSFNEGLAAVQLGEKCGFIDKTGNEVISPKYDSAYTFSEDLAAVSGGAYSKWGYIDKTGKVIIQLKYDDARSFRGGLAEVLGDKWFYIDKNGTEYYEP